MADHRDGGRLLATLRHSPLERWKYTLKFKGRPVGRYLQIRTVNSWWAEWYEIEIDAKPVKVSRRAH